MHSWFVDILQRPDLAQDSPSVHALTNDNKKHRPMLHRNLSLKAFDVSHRHS